MLVAVTSEVLKGFVCVTNSGYWQTNQIPPTWLPEMLGKKAFRPAQTISDHQGERAILRLSTTHHGIPRLCFSGMPHKFRRPIGALVATICGNHAT